MSNSNGMVSFDCIHFLAYQAEHGDGAHEEQGVVELAVVCCVSVSDKYVKAAALSGRTAWRETSRSSSSFLASMKRRRKLGTGCGMDARSASHEICKTTRGRTMRTVQCAMYMSTVREPVKGRSRRSPGVQTEIVVEVDDWMQDDGMGTASQCCPLFAMLRRA